MPSPVGLDQHVTSFHATLLAVRNRVNVLASFQNKAHGCRRVPMGIDCLTCLHQLHRHPQCVAGTVAHVGVDQLEDPAGPHVIGGDQPSGRV